MFPQVRKVVGGSTVTTNQTEPSSSSSSSGSGTIHRVVGLLQSHGEGLPSELLGIICDHLDLPSIVTFTSVCKYLDGLKYPSKGHRGLLRSQEWHYPPSRPHLAYSLGNNGGIPILELKLSEGITFRINPISDRGQEINGGWQQFFAKDSTVVKNICSQVTNLDFVHPVSLIDISILGYFPALKVLHFSSSSLTDFSFSIPWSWSTTLKTFTLNVGSLQTLPSRLDALVQLDTLTLRVNGLSQWPPNFAWPPLLKTLTLNADSLKTVVLGLDTLVQLQTLTLRVNSLSAFPKSFAWPPRLKTVTLSAAGQTLPLGLGALPQLEMLVILADKLTALPEDFIWAPQLKTLTLQVKE